MYDASVLNRRQTGILLHPSSLPGDHGIGDLGAAARRFVDWLADAGVGLWQVLPLGPTGGQHGDNPYSSWAALAGNPLLLSLDGLVADGLLQASDLEAPPFVDGWLDLERVAPWKRDRLHRAADRLLGDPHHPLAASLARFRETAGWAAEAGLFVALRDHHRGDPWWRWPEPLRRRAPEALRAARRTLSQTIDRMVALLFLFEHQWSALRRYAGERGIAILGDLPIYVRHDSVDVWTAPEAFQLADDGALLALSGSPPDEFTADGQIWSGTLYRWDRMAADDYAWWRTRVTRALEHADVVRIDHFRGLAAYWSIPAGARSALEGRWLPGPGLHFFHTLERHLGSLPLCVEDLGAIDDEVVALREATGLPGMRILHYGFGSGADNRHLPHNHPESCIAYPANHDNDTTLGWWRSLSTETRKHVQRYLGHRGDDIAWDLNRAALASVARTAVLQMQDVLGLPGAARMNEPSSDASPGATPRSWRWRMLPQAASDGVAERLRHLNDLYGRRPPGAG